jgi:L-ascorbate metabolism protein UlaG (beta-lactamase superfamily)
MNITHLTHSSFLIETKKAYMLFDYFGKGQLPQILKRIYIYFKPQPSGSF